MIPKYEKKNFPLPSFVELVESNPLILTLHFDQYSRFAIHLNIFWFSSNNSITNSKFEKKAFHQFVELVKTNPLMLNIKGLG